LKVLVEIAQEYGPHLGLLSDLKITYKWLNDHANDIRNLIVQENCEKIFLNVDDPGSDNWIWRSASMLVMDFGGLGEIHGVKDFLRNYNDLLKAAGVRKIHRPAAPPVPAADRTSVSLREQFNKMRQIGFGTDVMFEAKDHECQVPPAHKAWPTANNNHFWTSFIDSDFKESQTSGDGKHTRVVVQDFSSMCVKEVIGAYTLALLVLVTSSIADWMYTGKLSGALSSSNCKEKAQAKLELVLDMLALSHLWDMSDLHEHLQELIVNDPGFINPNWVGRSTSFFPVAGSTDN
jgi:hypothetical protein